MSKFRKKTDLIEASQWFKNGDHPNDYDGTTSCFENGVLEEIPGSVARDRGWEGFVVRYFRRPDVPGQQICNHCGIIMRDHGWIDTLEGDRIVCPGDWVITNLQGERYPCKPDIFIATYDPESTL